MFHSITRTVSLATCFAVLAVAGGSAQPGPGYGPASGPIYPPTYEDYAPGYQLGYDAYPAAPEETDEAYTTEGFQQSGNAHSFNGPNFNNSPSSNSVRPFDNSGRSPFANSGGVAPTIRRTPCGFYRPGNC